MMPSWTRVRGKASVILHCTDSFGNLVHLLPSLCFGKCETTSHCHWEVDEERLADHRVRGAVLSQERRSLHSFEVAEKLIGSEL